MISNPEATIVKSKLITSTREMSAASGSVAYTGVGFKPSCLIAQSADATPGYDFVMTIGVVDEALDEFSLYREPLLFRSGTGVLFRITESATQAQWCNVTSFDDDGFTLNWTKYGTPAAIVVDLGVLCLR